MTTEANLNDILADIEAAIATKTAAAQAHEAAQEQSRLAAERAWAEVNTLQDSASKIRDALAIASGIV